MCWNCLQSNHLDLPNSSERVTEAVRYLDSERALLAYLDPTLDPYNSWTGFAGNQRLPVIVTYNFVDAGDLPPNDGYAGSDGYFSYNARQRANFRDALTEISRVAGVIFVESENEAMINAYGSVGASVGGWANFPISDTWFTGDANLVVDDATNFDRGTYGFHTILHELGHTLGLKHPFEGENRLNSDLDTTSNTIMSYTILGNRQTLGPLDIAALRHLYGGVVNTSGWSMRFENGDFIASGSSRAETIVAIGQDSRVSGLGGSDRILGREGHDLLYGGLGNDTLEGGNGADRLDGGAGNDVLSGAAATEVVYTDSLPGALDTLFGGDGHDIVTAGVRRGSLYGGDGNDRLQAKSQTSWGEEDGLFGGAGADTLYGSGTFDTLNGGSGNDVIWAGATQEGSGGLGNDQMTGGLGANRLLGEAGRDTIMGGGGDDSLYGGDQSDTLRGGDGNDTLLGQTDADVLYGLNGNDSLSGGSGYDRLFGGDGSDKLDGEQGGGILWGGAGNDTLWADDGSNRLYGGDGRDLLSSSSYDAAALYGGAGSDTLSGTTGDTLLGGDGNDILYGRAGARLTGGAGADVFEFDTDYRQPATRVSDFEIGIDRIRVDIGANMWGNRLDSITLESVNGGQDTLATILVESSTNMSEILFRGITVQQLSPSMFHIY